MTESLRLFLIEDQDEHSLLIRRSLERSGHRVECCRTGADALIVLTHKPFDLVILDQQLEDITGVELLQRLSNEGVVVPVLMVTAYGDEKLAARVLRAGALDYIVKDPGLLFLTELPKRVVESVTRHRLEHLNGLLIQALESARDGIMITDLNGGMLKVNQALVELTGYSRTELVGQNPRLFKSAAQASEVFADMWRTILARKSWLGEIINRRKDGTTVPTSITISPIVDAQQRLTHFVGILRDITAQKALERQLLQAQKMQSVGTLAGGVAHEFNNLLAGINGYAALGLRETDVSPLVREFLTNVVTLSERAAGLTRQLLAFARKPALSRQPTQLAGLVRGTAELVTRTLHQDVTLEIADGLESALVEADANQLQQALINLALNGRDALRERTESQERGLDPRLIFRLRSLLLAGERIGFPQKVPPGDYLLLEVEDSGTGMSGDVLSQAVDPFFTTKDVGQGTGLGLPMVFGIVQGHQGFLTIDSTVGQGTCVSLYLPRYLEAVGASVDWDTSEQLEPKTSPDRSILVIDDEAAVLDVVRRFLQIAGHRVTTVTSGQEGTDLMAAGVAIDLVILDLMMPREDARQTFDRLRQLQPDVPVLLCTGLPEGGPSPELARHPHVRLIRKPFRMSEMWYAVRQAFGDA